jgi:hypothetical protein
MAQGIGERQQHGGAGTDGWQHGDKKKKEQGVEGHFGFQPSRLRTR